MGASSPTGPTPQPAEKFWDTTPYVEQLSLSTDDEVSGFFSETEFSIPSNAEDAMSPFMLSDDQSTTGTTDTDEYWEPMDQLFLEHKVAMMEERIT